MPAHRRWLRVEARRREMPAFEVVVNAVDVDDRPARRIAPWPSSEAAYFTGPGEVGDFATSDFLRFLLHDHIHHRGQLSVYVRMAGGRVPSIYGPSADEQVF